MATRNKSGTYGNQDVDNEISDLLIAISVKAKRLALKVNRLSGKEQLNKGGKPYGQSK